MSYVNNVLGNNEYIFYKASLSYFAFLGKLVTGFFLIIMSILIFINQHNDIIIAFILLIISCYILIGPFIAKYTTELVITNKRIIAKIGFVSRKTIELNLTKTESIQVHQSILGRVFNYGDIIIIGTGGTREPIGNIDSPIIFRKKFDEILSIS